MSYSVHFLFSSFLSVSRHIPDPTVCISHFPLFSVFLAILKFLKWLFLIIPIFPCFLPYSRPTVCVSQFPFFFSVFFPHCRSYSSISHFLSFWGFLAIFQVKKCLWNISRNNPGPKECISHFSRFSVFLAIFHILQCVFLIFHIFSYLAIFQVLECAFIIFHVFQYFSSYFTT